MLTFLAGAFLSVLDPNLVQWNWMLPVLGVGVIGLWMHRKAHHAEARSGERVAGNMATLEQSLANISRNLSSICGDKDNLPVHEARFMIDRLFRDDLNNFANARESMVHVFGMKNYADVMSSFAAGERYINRVWSASVDGYVDEVSKYLDRANDQFEHANELFSELRDQSRQDDSAVQPG